MQGGKVRLPVLLEIEDACSADGFSPSASLYLPSMLTCLRFPFVFLAAFEAKKMMKRPACCEFVLILGFSLSAGTKAMAKPILLSVLLLDFSFSFLCFSLFGSCSLFRSSLFFLFPSVLGFFFFFCFRSLCLLFLVFLPVFFWFPSVFVPPGVSSVFFFFHPPVPFLWLL
jgi:hypothetical protein